MSLKQQINFSLWCDFIEKDFLENEFGQIIADGSIYGATSNPAIFEQAISGSSAYKQHISMLQANDAKKIYEELAITDIKRAAELLKPLYESNNNDGFISLEVDPKLCDDAMGTIEEGARLAQLINAENLMIKVPATQAGYMAMKELTAMGINVNATLIFSPQQAKQCAQSLSEGISKSGKDTKAVVSVFVSRFDRACDPLLEDKGLEKAKLGIVNATKCYHEVEKFENPNIRTLFASTGVKGDDLAPSYYVDNLLYPNSINTAPLGTIQAWLKDGTQTPNTPPNEDECDLYLENLKKHAIDVDKVSDTLLCDGLNAFKSSFETLLSKIAQ